MLSLLKHRGSLGGLGAGGHQYVKEVYEDRGGGPTSLLEQLQASQYGRNKQFPPEIFHIEPAYVSQTAKARLPYLRMVSDESDEPFQYKDYSGYTVKPKKDWDGMTEEVTATEGMKAMLVLGTALIGIMLIGG